MPSLKAIRVRIASVKSTQKITRAMKLVAAARLRRAQDAIVGARPYANALADVVTSDASGTNADAIIAELRSFDSALRSSLELQAALTSPARSPADRHRH